MRLVDPDGFAQLVHVLLLLLVMSMLKCFIGVSGSVSYFGAPTTRCCLVFRGSPAAT